MNRVQKIAVTVLIVSLLALFLGITVILMRRFIPDFPKAAVAFGGLILAFGVIVFIGRFKKDKGAVTFDERDKLIENNAQSAGFVAVYLLVILVSYLPMGIAPEAKIPAKWFPFLLPLAVLCQCFAQSLAILIQYGKGGKDGEK
jgi:cytochrome c biogenesis protein CcdA